MACNLVGASRRFHSGSLPRRLLAMLITAVTLVNVGARSAQASPTASTATGGMAAEATPP